MLSRRSGMMSRNCFEVYGQRAEVLLVLLRLGLLLELVLVCGAVPAQFAGAGAVAEGDPAPGRSPGPPRVADTGHGVPEELPTIIMTAEMENPCDLDGDLIVVDKEKASVQVNFTHELFETNVLTLGVVYQVTVKKRVGASNVVVGFSLHSLGDGEPRGEFSGGGGGGGDSTGAKCMKSSVKERLDGDAAVAYNWTLALDYSTRSNVTFRLRYKIHSSPSVFQVNYAFAVSRGCQIWLRNDEANISSIDFPRTADCQINFPGHRNGHGLVLELTRLNVPCSSGGYLQFSGNTANTTQYRSHSAHFRSHKQTHLCGKLEELAESERRIYFPSTRNHAPYLHLHGHPVFSLSYHLVDYCYNVTFTTRNGSFELQPAGELQCTFKIYLPYGNRVVLKLEIGDPNASRTQYIGPATQTSSSQTTEISTARTCKGLLTELWDGSSSWIHCSKRGDPLRNIEIESRDNRVVMKIFVRGNDHNIGLKFRYYAEPVQNVVRQCSFGWVAVRQFCVTAVENVRLPWQQAEKECNRRGGHLASIRSDQAQNIIDNLLINSPGYRDQNAYWLGATDTTYEGDFRWSDGLPFTYTNWFPGWLQHDHYNRQPNDDGLSEQDCVELRRVYHLPSATLRLAPSFMWNDRDCSTPNYFLCERLIANEPLEDGWPPECNRTVSLSREQPRTSVSSPGFPRPYPDNAECQTEITASTGYKIVMDFEELVLEKEPYCSYDYLEIIEMAPQNQSTTRRLCGDWSAKLKLLRYVSAGSRLRLRFVSDYSHHFGGFKARVSMENAVQCADDRLSVFNNSCYLFVNFPEVVWSTAQQICEGINAQLASVLSPEEERFITTTIRNMAEYRTSAVYWLGGNMTAEGKYQWVDGSPMLYSGWLPGQDPEERKQVAPVTPEPFLCLGMQYMTFPKLLLPSGLYWRAKNCSSVGGYVCKRRIEISGSDLNLNRTVNGTEGRLTSPNYPGNYYNNLDFLIRITGPERTRIILQFSKINIEPQLDCLYDYVEIKTVFRGNSEELNDAVKWCGNYDTDMERFNFVSETNEAELRFHSDYSISGSGFSLTWSAVDVSACPLQTLTAREGVVTSPNYPHFLLARLDCAITILAPAEKRVWLEITDYDMGGRHYELGHTRTTAGFRVASDAILEIDLGGSTSAFEPFQLAGHIADGAFVSSAQRLQLRLRTADQPVGAGFRAIYKTVNGIQEERIIDLMNISSGTLLHLNYPNEAPAHIDFLQHLVAPIGNVILLELYHVKFMESSCSPGEGSIDVMDNYADSNGTYWHLCREKNHDLSIPSAPLAITSYLNTLYIRQRGGTNGIPLNGSLRVQPDVNYKIKLLRQEENVVESCNPNPCQNNGKCVSNGSKKFCQCNGHFTGLFCALTMCELEPCVFGQCTLTVSSYRCHCQTGYRGVTCEQKQRPCEGNPCESRGECIERADSFHCRCHAWWEGPRCERRMVHIPFRPLSERMLHEPFWLGLITVTIVLAVIGLVWCARRHFPEKLEKLLAEESDRRGCPGPTLRGSSVREQLSGSASAAVMVVPSPQPGCQRSLFGRLGIRKPSILSLTSPHGQTANHHTTAATARTFSLDDLLKPPPRRTPSPRKKRNNSTPTKKNAAEKKQILQQLISPSNQQRSRKVSIGELIQLSERKVKEAGDKDTESSSNEVKETSLGDNSIASAAQLTLTDPKLEKKVTFARLLNRVSAEMSSGSEVELGILNTTRISTLALKSASTPPSPATETRSPNSTSSNQGSDSLSSSDLAIPSSSGYRATDKKKNIKLANGRQKPASADSILQMFRNFSSTSAAVNVSASVKVSPSTTPTASSPQDDVEGDDESTTSSIHTPVSFSSGVLDSPLGSRKQSNSTIEVPVLDVLSAHKCNNPGSNLLHPPTILLEVPSSISKCLSPIREMPTPLPTPISTPLPSPCRTPIMHRSTASSSAEDLGMDFSDDRISVELPCISVGYSDDEEVHSAQDIAIDIQAEDGLIQEEAIVMQQTCAQAKFKPRPPPLGQTTEAATSSNNSADKNKIRPVPPPLIIPTLTIQQPSPTRSRPPMLNLPGSPPPQRAPTNTESSFQFNEKGPRRLLKELDKPTSLDLPCAPPMITVTCNMSEAESDAESLSPATKTANPHLGTTSGTVGMCYLSPFSMCSRADRTASESNLSSSGYSSMASPGPSRCGSNNPLCPSEMEDPGPPGPSSTNIHSQMPRRPSPLLKTTSSSTGGSTADNNSTEQRGHCRGRSDSETLSDDPLLESNDEGIGTDHLDEKIEDGELKSAKELEIYIGKDLLENNKLTIEMPKLPSCLPQSNVLTKCEPLEPSMDRLMPPPVTVCKVSLQLPSIVVQSESSGCDKHVSPVSSRSESPLSDRTVGLARFSPQFYSKQKDLLPFTDSDGLYDFPSSDCAPQNKISILSTMQQHRKSTGRKREKKPSRALKSQSPTRNQPPHHQYHLDVPSKDQHYRIQQPRKPSPKRRARNQQMVGSSSSSESLDSVRQPKISSSSPSPDTIRWSSPTHWTEGPSRRRSHDSSGEDTPEELSSAMVPTAAEDAVRQSKKISRLRTISHQIRFLRRLEKSLKKRDRLACPSDSVEDSGDGEDFSHVTSPLLQPQVGLKPEIRKSNSSGRLQTVPGNAATRFKRGKTKKGSDLLIPQEEITWKQVLATGNGHSD